MKEYLTVFNAQAEERFRTIVEEMKANAGVNEALKAQDQMEWVRQMNSIAKCAEEFILSEMVYC